MEKNKPMETLWKNVLFWGGLALIAAGLAWLVGLGQTQPAPERPPAPSLVLPDLEGETFRLADHRGEVVLVNFWATWCPPCRKEMPSMQRLWEAWKGRPFRVVAVDVGEEESAAWAFAATEDLTFTILLDNDSAVSRAWGVRGLPTTFLIDPAGRIAFTAIGERTWDEPQMLQKMEALFLDDASRRSEP